MRDTLDWFCKPLGSAFVLGRFPSARSRALACGWGLGVLLVGCGPSAIPQASSADVARAQARWPDANQAQLDRGRRSYVVHCGGCHVAIPPAKFSASAWEGHVERMAGKAKLAEPEKSMVLRYLAIAARPESARK